MSFATVAMNAQMLVREMFEMTPTYREPPDAIWKRFAALAVLAVVVWVVVPWALLELAGEGE